MTDINATRVALARAELRIVTRRLEQAKADAISGRCSEARMRACMDLVQIHTDELRRLTEAA